MLTVYGSTWLSCFKKSLLCISRHTLPTRLDLSGHVCLWIALAYPSTWTTYRLDRLLFQREDHAFCCRLLRQPDLWKFFMLRVFIILAPEHSYLALCVI